MLIDRLLFIPYLMITGGDQVKCCCYRDIDGTLHTYTLYLRIYIYDEKSFSIDSDMFYTLHMPYQRKS